jgi:hypothetical protein
VDRSGETVENAGTQPGLERRSSPRARSRVEASYEDVDRQVFLYTVDLSEDGVFLISPTSPPIGASAMVLLELPGNPVILRLRGSVARQQTQPVAGFAVRFDPRGTADTSRRSLRDFVESTRSGPASSHPG